MDRLGRRRTRGGIGGIYPLCGELWSRTLSDAVFTGKRVEVTGERGFRWKGVRVTTRPAHRDWRWLHLECEYLTLPGSNLLAVRLRAHNLTSAEMRSPLGIACWCQPGGEREKAVAIYQRGEQVVTRRRSDYSVHVQATSWAAVQHYPTGTTLLLVSPAADSRVEVMDCGRQGAHLAAYAELRLKARESREMLLWLALTRYGERVAIYREALQQITQLP